MSDDRDPFERDLARRLRAHEDHAPGGQAPGMAGRGEWRRWLLAGSLAIGGLVVGSLLAVLLLQRPQPPTGNSSPDSSPSQASFGSDLVAVPTSEPYFGETPQACPAAAPTGTLARDSVSGLVLVDGGLRHPVIWPFGYVAREADRGLELLDADGQIVAREGDVVRLGGGETTDGFWACGGVIEIVVAAASPTVFPSTTAHPEVVCRVPAEDCELALSAAADLLQEANPAGPDRVVVIWGRGRAFHAEVHACFADGRYLLIDAIGQRGARPAGSIRDGPWADPPCD